MFRFTSSAAVLVALSLCCANVSAGPEWIEASAGDAGDKPGTAQPTGGHGPLAKVTGVLHVPVGNLAGGNLNLQDMYIVHINNPELFIATTMQENGFADFDSQLWLFTLEGRGLLGNNNTLPNPANANVCRNDFDKDGVVNCNDLLSVINAWSPCECCLGDSDCDGLVNVNDLLEVINNWGPVNGGCDVKASTLGYSATDGTKQTIPGPGLYLLAISSAGTVPASANGPLFSFGCDPGEISGPDGPGGGDIITDWVLVDCEPAALGDYSIYVGGGSAVEMSGLFMDIKPGVCPNSHNPGSNGELAVSIVGSGGFNSNLVNTSTIVLARADGVGSEVSLIDGSAQFQDFATAFTGGLCGCDDQSGDGVDDVNVAFSSCEMRSAFQLDDLQTGTNLILEVRGEFMNGTPFVAQDCIWIVPPLHLLATTQVALQATGNAIVDVDGVIQVNSSHKSATTVSGNSVLNAFAFNLHGGVSQTGNSELNGPINFEAAQINDPFTTLAEPNSTGAVLQSSSKLTLTGRGNHNLLPGRYVGGISLSGNLTVNLAPGIYYIEGGGFSVSGNVKVNANHAMIYNSRHSLPDIAMDQIKISGNSIVNWTPLLGDVYDGIAIFQDRTIDSAQQSAIAVSGNNQMHIHGTIYAEHATVQWSGNGFLDLLGGGVVAQKLQISGNGTMSIGMCGD